MEGDDHGEAYTVIVWGVGLSHEILEIAGAEAVAIAEGNMCGAVMRGTVALPGSEAISRTDGSRWNLGDLVWPAVARVIPGRDRKSRRRSCRGTDEESDGCIVPLKHRTKPTEIGGGDGGGKAAGRREGKHSNACSGLSAGFSMSLKQCACGSMASKPTIAFDLRREPGAGKLHAGICGGGVG